MKDRELTCIHYEFEGSWDLGKKAEFYGHCQTCKTYKAKPGSKPARENTKREKLKEADKREFRNEAY